MVDTIKFSQFVNGGDLSNDKTIVGLDASLAVNTRFNVPWTYLTEGTTGDRPIPAPEMYYRQRFNTSLEVYEYYDPTIPLWTQLSGSGTGTVNPGVVNNIAFYAASGTSVSPLASLANAVLVTSPAGLPSLSTTFPAGLSLPGATITASTAALTSGSVVAAPVLGADLVNKTYADSLLAGAVLSATGTTNQVLVNGVAGIPTSGAITLSLPQDIAAGSTPTFGGMTLTSIPLAIASGGTGNTTFTAFSVVCAGTTNTGAMQNVSGLGTTGQQLTSNGPGVLPTWQNSGAATPEALTRTDDTNVTLTLGGTPATSLLQAVSITAGWAGQLSLTRGGSNASLTASDGGIVFSTASAMSILAGTATAGQIIRSGASAAPTWSTTTYPATNALNTIMFASSANVLGVITPANSSILITSAGGVPSWSTTIPAFTTASITFNTTSGIIGTTTNNNAAAGSQGQFITASGGPVTMSVSGVNYNVTSASLTAGDWDLGGNFILSNLSSTMSSMAGALNTTSATLGGVYTQAGNISTSNQAYPCPQVRLSLASTTTVYLVAQSVFTGTASTVSGIIRARRVR